MLMSGMVQYFCRLCLSSPLQREVPKLPTIQASSMQSDIRTSTSTQEQLGQHRFQLPTSTQLFQSSTPLTVKKKRDSTQIEESRQNAVKRRAVMDYLRPLQKEALESISKCGKNAIVIMPTGSGKTALVSAYKVKGKCSIVFAPYTLLVSQLTSILMKDGVAISFPFERPNNCVYDVLMSADYIIMPFEAAPGSADLISTLNRIGRLGPVWIDEVRFVFCSNTESINIRNCL